MSFDQSLTYTKQNSYYLSNQSDANEYLKEYAGLQTNYEIYEKFSKDIVNFNSAVNRLAQNVGAFTDEVLAVCQSISMFVTINGSTIGDNISINSQTVRNGNEGESTVVGNSETKYKLMTIKFQNNSLPIFSSIGFDKFRRLTISATMTTFPKNATGKTAELITQTVEIADRNNIEVQRISDKNKPYVAFNYVNGSIEMSIVNKMVSDFKITILFEPF